MLFLLSSSPSSGELKLKEHSKLKVGVDGGLKGEEEEGAGNEADGGVRCGGRLRRERLGVV
jgi:hypothetical protein